MSQLHSRTARKRGSLILNIFRQLLLMFLALKKSLCRGDPMYFVTKSSTGFLPGIFLEGEGVNLLLCILCIALDKMLGDASFSGRALTPMPPCGKKASSVTAYTCWTEPSLTFDLHKKSNVRRGSFQHVFFHAEIIE